MVKVGLYSLEVIALIRWIVNARHFKKHYYYLLAVGRCQWFKRIIYFSHILTGEIYVSVTDQEKTQFGDDPPEHLLNDVSVT